jgi:hypothetical protein
METQINTNIEATKAQHGPCMSALEIEITEFETSKTMSSLDSKTTFRVKQIRLNHHFSKWKPWGLRGQ